MDPESEVEVTNRDGSTARGTLLDVLPIHTEDYTVNRDGTRVTLHELWDGECDPWGSVALVAFETDEEYLSDAVLAYPEDKVRVIADA